MHHVLGRRACRVSMEKVEGKKSLGRHRHREEDNIKMNFR
jgi:hypothetical protein